MTDKFEPLHAVAAGSTSGLRKSRSNFPVFGLGASAGGLEALQQFLAALTADSGAACVVVMHLSPHHDSHIVGLLQPRTDLRVVQVTDAVRVEPNHVYVIPPNHDLFMDDDHLRLAEPVRLRGPHLAIDLFFRTMAEVHQARAVGVVLSGTGSDGSVGLKRIKEVGGLTLAQAPEDARYPQMPQSAIATGMVDFILPAGDMPARLLQLWHNADRLSVPMVPPDDDSDLLPEHAIRNFDDADEQALLDIISTLRSRTGHDFRHYKRATVLRRIARRLQVCGIEDLPRYADHLRQQSQESTVLLQDMLISVTSFFRDRDAFAVLERQVVPAVFDALAAEEPLRAWIAGCATGEEAYSVSMLLCEAAQRMQRDIRKLQVFATDIDERALAIARRGVYPTGILADVSPQRIASWFHPSAEGLRVHKTIRDTMLFATHNILRDPPFSRLDMICCRNLLIYVGREAQTNILEMFHFALKPGGYLFLGGSESADSVSSLFTVVDKKNRIFRASPHAQASRSLPLPTLTSFSHNPLASSTAVPLRGKVRTALSDLHARALEQFAPSILIDDKLNILHLAEDVGRYMHPAGGIPSTELLLNVRPSLRIELRSALFQHSQTGRRVNTRAVAYEADGRAGHVRMSVCPLPKPDIGRRLLLVVFEDIEIDGEASPHSDDPAEQALTARYENELSQLREHLRITVEQADISTEDLKVTNEELQAINEELRSATEELETSKEELQSMNEELTTVNSELEGKVHETSQVNDDLQNFLIASEIATLFVDREMRIKRFTPEAAIVFNVIPADIDRPLLDITHRLDYPQMASDLHAVFDKLAVVERPVAGANQRYYLARLRPYRTTQNNISGAMLTFVDVTELREAQQAVVDSQQQPRT